MDRDYRFDIARILCMAFIVAYVHCYGYIYNVISPFKNYPAAAILTDSALGLFTFVSGYLLGRKYNFSKWSEVVLFYRKRVLRIFPLFLLASLGCWLIGLNSARATFNGIVCISPFIKPRPLTMWYIPVIVICYLFTPLINRGSIKRKVIVSFVVVLFLSLLTMCFKTVDIRLVFNVFFYLLGMCTATCFDWRLDNRQCWVKYIVVLFFLVLLIVGQFYYMSDVYRKGAAAVGVVAFLFVCGWIEKIIYPSRSMELVNDSSSTPNPIRNWAGVLIDKLSYCSFAAYLFHRVFFWAGERLWNPSIHWIKWIYMAGVVFPILCVLSYFIQYLYDAIVKIISNKSMNKDR